MVLFTAACHVSAGWSLTSGSQVSVSSPLTGVRAQSLSLLLLPTLRWQRLTLSHQRQRREALVIKKKSYLFFLHIMVSGAGA